MPREPALGQALVAPQHQHLLRLRRCAGRGAVTCRVDTESEAPQRDRKRRKRRRSKRTGDRIARAPGWKVPILVAAAIAALVALGFAFRSKSDSPKLDAKSDGLKLDTPQAAALTFLELVQARSARITELFDPDILQAQQRIGACRAEIQRKWKCQDSVEAAQNDASAPPVPTECQTDDGAEAARTCLCGSTGDAAAAQPPDPAWVGLYTRQLDAQNLDAAACQATEVADYQMPASKREGVLNLECSKARPTDHYSRVRVDCGKPVGQVEFVLRAGGDGSWRLSSLMHLGVM
jgi:hypothetical protein